MQKKIIGFGINSAAKYFLLAGFYSLFHSLLEEYYWRWFVFRQLERLIPLWPAIILSGIAFTLHHIVVLAIYFQRRTVARRRYSRAPSPIGGCFWAWLYHRSNSIFELGRVIVGRYGLVFWRSVTHLCDMLSDMR